MAQIINQESFGGNLGTNLGQALGQGLSSGLQQLANQKLERMHKKSIQHDLRSAFPEIPEEAIAFIASKPAKEQLQILETLGQQRQAQQEQQALAQQQQQANGLQALQQQEPMQQQDVTIPDDHYTPEVIQHLEEQLSSPEATQQFPPEQLEKARANLLAMQQKLSQSPVGTSPFPKESEVVEPKIKKSGIELATLAKASKDNIAKEKQALAKEKHEFAKEKLATEEKREAFRQTKEERKQILDEAKEAKQSIQDLDRLEELDKKGNLDTAGYTEFLKRSGLDIPALLNPESEEFNKVAATFARGAKAYFGGNVSNYETEQFLKTIPSLMQSPEGRKRVISNLKNYNRLKVATLDAYKDIMKENYGVPPFDISEQIDDRLEKRREELAERFKKDLAKPVPESQNKLVTAAQAVAGDIFGNIGKGITKAASGAAKGAIGGALYGRVAGGPGALGGAAIGGLAGLLGLI